MDGKGGRRPLEQVRVGRGRESCRSWYYCGFGVRPGKDRPFFCLYLVASFRVLVLLVVRCDVLGRGWTEDRGLGREVGF